MQNTPAEPVIGQRSPSRSGDLVPPAKTRCDYLSSSDIDMRKLQPLLELFGIDEFEARRMMRLNIDINWGAGSPVVLRIDRICPDTHLARKVKP